MKIAIPSFEQDLLKLILDLEGVRNSTYYMRLETSVLLYLGTTLPS